MEIIILFLPFFFCIQNKLSPGQNRILYSLYGVVEHTGFLHSGHYIAYVKVRVHLLLTACSKIHFKRINIVCIIQVREPVKDDSYRFSFLEGSKSKPPKVIDGNDDPSHLTPNGDWYYISDCMVRKVTPNTVLNCQAYLLFYERIL